MYSEAVYYIFENAFEISVFAQNNTLLKLCAETFLVSQKCKGDLWFKIGNIV